MSSFEVVFEGRRARAELLDRYVEFVAARCRPNTVIATVSDLRVFPESEDEVVFEISPAEFENAWARGRHA